MFNYNTKIYYNQYLVQTDFLIRNIEKTKLQMSFFVTKQVYKISEERFWSANLFGNDSSSGA